MYSEKVLSLLKDKNLNLNNWFKKNYYELREKDTSYLKEIIKMCNNDIDKYQNEIDKLKNMQQECKVEYTESDKNQKIKIWLDRIESINNDNIPKLKSTKDYLNKKLNETNDKYVEKIIILAINEMEESLNNCCVAIRNYNQSIKEIKTYTSDEIIQNKILAYQKIINTNQDDIEREISIIKEYEKYNKNNNVEKVNKEINKLFPID